jgi:tRNA pseudouridine32 synthase/23S rRNA pseudouridine746 synthase
MPPLDILFEDDHLLALNKPSGLLSVPGKHDPLCLTSLALNYDANIRVVHRLDMATSGIMIFAKSYAVQKALGQLFERRQIQKTYHAMVQGRPSASQGAVNLPIVCDWPNRPRQKICWESGKSATTHYAIHHYFTDAQVSLMHLTPLSGRSHQLRIHCLALGHPILGDQLYHQDGSQSRSNRLLLHSARIEFIHPITQTWVTISHESQFGLTSLCR